MLKISAITVRRDWEFARAWLYKELHSARLNPLDSDAARERADMTPPQLQTIEEFYWEVAVAPYLEREQVKAVRPLSENQHQRRLGRDETCVKCSAERCAVRPTKSLLCTQTD